jgi:two-component system sensor histidine kinase UhpB
LRITIADNGRGYDPAQASSGIGIIGMRERVGVFNGSLEVDTGQAGTTITIVLPLST